MKEYYVIGNKASKSLSPTIFNYWFKKYKINAVYGYLEFNNNNFDKNIKTYLTKKNIGGMNITIPFKQKIMKHLDVLDSHSKKINAVNCVVFKSKTMGFNTDWEGYYKSLPKNNNLKKKKVLIIGYGGAALAIHYILLKKGFKHITIINRSKKKIKFNKKTRFTKNIKHLEECLKSSEFIINTIPKNILNNKNIKLVDKKTLLSDIVYNPKETDFLNKFSENKKIYGIQMLLNQAAACFKLWFGFSPIIDQALLNILEKKIQ